MKVVKLGVNKTKRSSKRNIHISKRGFTVATHSKKNGFTLIELMVVIVIIGALAAFAIPKFSTGLASSKVSGALVNVNALYKESTILVGEVGSITAWSDINATDMFAYCKMNTLKNDTTDLFDYEVTIDNTTENGLIVKATVAKAFGPLLTTDYLTWIIPFNSDTPSKKQATNNFIGVDKNWADEYL